MKQRNLPKPAHVFGIDIGKNLFHVGGVDLSGQPIQKAEFRRETLLQFFERAEPAIVGMESCPGSQWLARKLVAMGSPRVQRRPPGAALGVIRVTINRGGIALTTALPALSTTRLEVVDQATIR